MASSRITQPALLGGLFIGVLSSLPLLNAANCCCLWVIAGGLLTTYVLQQQSSAPIQTSDAALAGLVAGAIGAILHGIGAAILLNWISPVWQDQVRAQLETNPDVPPAVRDFVLRLVTGRGLALLQFAVTLPMFAIFSMLGALLGVTFFRKKTPPVPPPGFGPPGGTGSVDHNPL